MNNQEKEEVKQIIIDMVRGEFVHKDKIWELLQETEWSDEKDYRIRYLDFHDKIRDLL